MYCPKCGSVIPEGSSFCTRCGAPTTASSTMSSGMSDSEKIATVYVNKKSEALAIIFSLFITGLGEMYAGKIGKGILLLVLQIVVALTLGLIFFGIPNFIIWIYSMYDSYQLVKIHNAKLLANMR